MRTPLKSRYYDPAKLARLGNLQLIARTVVEGYIAGLHRSPFRGLSAEFAEYREYLPGDDLKHFDWRVFARTDKKYVRRYEEETNLTCTLLLDASGSMGYGSGELTKFDYAGCLAAALTYLMVRQRDRVGLALFDREVRLRLPPRSSPAQMKNVLERLEEAEPRGETGAGAALHSVAESLTRRALVIVLSDLIDEQDQVVNALNHFRHDRNEVLVFNVFDPAERDLPQDGLVEFRDMETGGRMQVRPDVIRRDYRARFEQFLDRYREECAAAHVDYQPVTTDRPYELALAAYLDRRRKWK
ncbi:MAG: DUF58 domain-containing protein [Planctomycetota bacterium]